ncbi:hypothetical protein QYE76_063073 [Lolium multiflorum]|uniref:Retrotransposon gag domain-containing protein n=1 Tax=Lolium multiflorum TaxID=4521 RepID=A0AAD8S5P3_LOLMU|nr:hypothetical protein QYE76_063073 [Lolium multiflorum]
MRWHALATARTFGRKICGTTRGARDPLSGPGSFPALRVAQPKPVGGFWRVTHSRRWDIFCNIHVNIDIHVDNLAYSTSEMAEEPITYEGLPTEHKKKYDDLKAILEAELIGSFEKTRSHGVRFKGFAPQGVLEGVDLSLPSQERTQALRQEINYVVAHSLHRHSRAWRSRLHQEGLPEQEQLFRRRTAAAGSLGAEAEKQAWLAKYTTAPVQESSAATTSTADQISAVLRDQFGILPKKKIIGYSKPYPNEFDLIPLPPKYRLPDFNKFSGSEGSSSIEHVSRYLAQLGMVSVSDQLRVRFFSQSLTGPAFGWYTSLQPNSVQSWKQLEELFHTQYHSEATKLVLPNRFGKSEERQWLSTSNVSELSRTDAIRFT